MEIIYSSTSPEKMIKAEKLQLILVAFPLLVIVPEMIEENFNIVFIVLNILFGLLYLTLVVNYKKIIFLTENRFNNLINLFNGIVVILTCSLPMFVIGKKYIPIIYLLIGLFHIFFFGKIQNNFKNKNRIIINSESFTLVKKIGNSNLMFLEIKNIEVKKNIISITPKVGKIIKLYVNLTENQLNELNKVIDNKISLEK